MITKAGKHGGGTYAHFDIAMEFASWISPEFKYFDDENKMILINATKRKLEYIFNYIAEHLKDNSINPIVYADLEIIADLSCFLKDNGINELIDKID